MKPQYETCPVCGKKGWYRESGAHMFLAMRCRYCGSWLTTHKWSVTAAKTPPEYNGWVPIESPRLHPGPSTPKPGASTGICGRITYGYGKLDENGYWEYMVGFGEQAE